MYSIIEDVITKGNYELVDIINKLNKLWVESYLTEEQRDNLIVLARAKAKPDNSYAKNAEQIANLWEYYGQLNSRLLALEIATNPDIPIVEGYPEYVQPTGSHDAYYVGYKVLFHNKIYVCKMNNCVWDPLVYPDAWEEIGVNDHE